MSVANAWTKPNRLALGTGVVGLLAAALLFRIVGLDHWPGMNGDEAQYASRLNQLRAGLPVALVTGSGLPLNPFYSGLLWLVQVVWTTPSFWVVRLPAVLSGLALLALAYPLLKQLFDRPTALGATLLLACLPLPIAYSRFGWDQSQAPLASLLCLYFGLQRQVLGMMASLMIAVMVHPANVFLAPIMLGPTAAVLLARWSTATPEEKHRWRHAWGWTVGLGVPISILILWGLVPAPIRTLWLEQVLPGLNQRLACIPDWVEFALLWGDLLTGTTIYRYITGPVPAWSVALQRLFFWGLLLGLLVRGLPPLVRQHNLPVLGLLGGLAFSLAAFYLLAGLPAIEPGQERYAAFLVVPSGLALVLLAAHASAKPLPLWGTLGVGTLLLMGFWQHYFVVLWTTGGEAHRTFRTGPVEPKQAAFEAIVATAAGQPVTILAEDWWCYFPLHYLAHENDAVRVQFCHRSGNETEGRRRFLVGFADGPCDRWFRQRGTAVPPLRIPDYAGRTVLYVWDLGTSPELLPDLAALCQQQVVDKPR